MPFENDGDETPDAEQKVKATLCPKENNEKDRIGIKCRLCHQAVNGVAKHGATRRRQKAGNEHKPSRPAPLSVLLPKALDQLHFLWRKFHSA